MITGTDADDAAEDVLWRASVVEAARRLVSPPRQGDRATLLTARAVVRS
jgi:hypothetical protein